MVDPSVDGWPKTLGKAGWSRLQWSRRLIEVGSTHSATPTVCRRRSQGRLRVSRAFTAAVIRRSPCTRNRRRRFRCHRRRWPRHGTITGPPRSGAVHSIVQRAASAAPTDDPAFFWPAYWTLPWRLDADAFALAGTGRQRAGLRAAVLEPGGELEPGALHAGCGSA